MINQPITSEQMLVIARKENNAPETPSTPIENFDAYQLIESISNGENATTLLSLGYNKAEIIETAQSLLSSDSLDVAINANTILLDVA